MFGSEGGTQTDAVKITSYRYNSDFPGDVTKREDVPVTLNYKVGSDLGNGNFPTTYGTATASKVEGNGKETTGITTMSYELIKGYDQQTNPTPDLDHATVLKNTNISTYHNSVDKCYNLSNEEHPMSKDVVNTANTYLIDGPGWYCIPLVYGNAFKNGINNIQAYQDFEYAAGSKFNDPWIKNNAPETPTAGKVVLEPTTGTITDVTVDQDHKFLRFQVTNEIKPGNAVIAVTNQNSGRILWSWQLWFTAVDYTDVTEIRNGSNTYYLAPYEVGFVSSSQTIDRYPDRTIEVEVTQKRGDNDKMTKTFVIKQEGKTANKYTGGTVSFYQWGRKDPFPSTGILYNISPYSYEPGDKVATDIGTQYENGIKYYEAIATPTVFYNYRIYPTGGPGTSTANWGTTHDWQTIDAVGAEPVKLWGLTYKTIFDPSPVGFRVPQWAVFTSVDGLNNAEYSNNLFTVYANKNSTEEKFYLPSTGGRDAGNAKDEWNPATRINRNTSCLFWTTSPYETTGGNKLRIMWSFHIQTNTLNKSYKRGGNTRADGVPVMPIKE